MMWVDECESARIGVRQQFLLPAKRLCICDCDGQTDSSCQLISVGWLRIGSTALVVFLLPCIIGILVGGMLSEMVLLHGELSDVGIR